MLQAEEDPSSSSQLLPQFQQLKRSQALHCLVFVYAKANSTIQVGTGFLPKIGVFNFV